jgi:hypothetical protein
MAKDALPTVGDDSATDRRDDAIEGIEEAVLSGIDGTNHGGRNSLPGRWLSMESRPPNVERKTAIKSYFSESCAKSESAWIFVGDVKAG